MKPTACRYSAHARARVPLHMGLERHVAEIVECQHAVIGRFTQNRRHGQSHRREEFGHVHEGKRLVIERCRADSQHERTSPAGTTRKYRRSEASPVSGTTRADDCFVRSR